MSKHQHTPASAAVGIEHAIRMLEGRWKLVILFHLFGGQEAALLGSRARDSGHLTEDADPAASAARARRHRRAHRPRTGAAEGRVPPDQLGAVPVPGARRAPHVGGETALIPKRFAKCKGHAPSARLTSQMSPLATMIAEWPDWRNLVIGGTLDNKGLTLGIIGSPLALSASNPELQLKHRCRKGSLVVRGRS